MHRYCAGVSVEHYASLDKSPLPFNCSLCVQRKQAALIDDLKSTIAVLTAEVAELRAALAEQQQPVQDNSSDNDRSKWSDVVTRRPRRRPVRAGPATQSQNRTTSGNNQGMGAADACGSRCSVNVTQQRVATRLRVTVPGVRKVWGTKKDATTTVVLRTIRQLTKIDPEKRLTVKRKFQEGGPGRRDRWWFLIRGYEAVLGELENLWNSVSLQVGWKLEMCTKPSDDESEMDGGTNANESEHVHANLNPNNEESNGAQKGSNSTNSPPLPNTNNPGMSRVTRSNQPNNMQTSNVDVNNTNSSQYDSDAHNSHHNPVSTPCSDNNIFLDK